jgi:hypothetical protein
VSSCRSLKHYRRAGIAYLQEAKNFCAGALARVAARSSAITIATVVSIFRRGSLCLVCHLRWPKAGELGVEDRRAALHRPLDVMPRDVVSV